MSWIDSVKNTARISNVVSRYVSIGRPKLGGKLLIRCPFHKEKTPSFSIDETKNLFHCFGCKVSGDCIRFVELIEKTDFLSASKLIAGMYRIEIDTIEKVNKLIELVYWCQDNLKKNKEIMEYLTARGLNNKTIDKFQIGWLPHRDKAKEFCEAKALNQTELQKYGLDKLYLFENRIIFPIWQDGVVVGLGGRALDSKNRAKYINSSDSPYFKKKTILYGFNHLNHSNQSIYLMEGYLDVCIAWQSGYRAVSCLGTAVSEEQLKLMWGRTEEIIVAMDADIAGHKASAKLAKEHLHLISPDHKLSFIQLPDDHDPASFLLLGNKLEALPSITLAEKLWNFFDPRGQAGIHDQVNTYKQLLSTAKEIQDEDLRREYCKYWRDKWLSRTVSRQMGPAVVRTDDAGANYQIILLATLLYNPNAIIYLIDYIATLPLANNLEHIRNILLQEPIDIHRSKMLELAVELCPLNKLNRIAPFTKQEDTTVLVTGWLEIYKFYLDFLASTG